MKTIILTALLLIFCMSLIGCKSQSQGKSSVSESKSEISVSSKSMSITKPSKADEQSSVPSTTTKTSDGQKSDLAKARLALYGAGINSAAFSDEEILHYWRESQEKGVDFVDYFKDVTGIKK